METRIDIINFLSNKFGAKNYLEIGVRNPWECFDHIVCENKDSVDPGFENAENNVKYKYTSDDFFRLLESGKLDKEKDFKPQFTTKSSGTGLGLAMVKNIIEAYNGTISFTSQENTGTVFKIIIPKK